MELSRRKLLAGVAAVGAASFIPARANTPEGAGETTKHELPKLLYGYDALEPYIDARTMELHHSKHHSAYVAGLNAAEKQLAAARASGDFGQIQHLSRQAAFHGGGHFLHSLFWRVMAPAGKGGGGEPQGDLSQKIIRDFGSFSAFQKQFSAAAAGVEGSGWAILHYRRADKRLLVLQAENQQKLSAWGIEPLLAIDVWEHAYYLKYQNKRNDYIAAWWNVVNWPEVARNLETAMK
ncbi:superoxide dismutase [Ignavibacteria bacterium]|nr:superoxide dismutase [Bacteroidota bacterium]MCZ2132947.1 superoxide dismutase [Bacteroidota bacterium]